MATQAEVLPASLPQIASIENKFFSMAEASLSITGTDALSERHREIISAVITEFGCGIAEMLTHLQPRIALNEDDIVLTLPLPKDRTIEEARANLANEKNSYHLFEIIEENGGEALLRFRVSTVERKEISGVGFDPKSAKEFPRTQFEIAMATHLAGTKMLRRFERDVASFDIPEAGGLFSLNLPAVVLGNVGSWLLKALKGNAHDADKAKFQNMLNFMKEVGIFSETKKRVEVKNTPADFLQGLLKSWLKFPLPRVPRSLRTGVYQKVAESLNSFFSLYYEGDAAGKQAGFPSLDERRPEIRARMYRTNLEILCRRTTPLEYRTARELYPGEYKPDDRRGDRLVCISEDWLKFIERPFPGRFPAFFVNQGGKSPVVVYEHLPSQRLHAFLPLLTADEGLLAPQSNDAEWFSRRSDFKALSLFEKSWPQAGTGIMVPLDYDSNPHQPDRMKIQNAGSHAQFNRDTIAPRHESKGKSEFAELRRQMKRRRSHDSKPKRLEKSLRHQGRIERLLRSGLGIGTVLLKEFRSPHPNRAKNNGSQRAWKIQFALKYANQVPLQTRTMGVHFGDKPVVYWQIHGASIHGSFDWSAQIEKALASQAELEKDQRRSRSTANRSFSHKNRAWVRDVARKIVQTAKRHGCSLAREVVKYVPQKHSGDSVLNRRFSMWCFSDLGAAIDHECNKQGVFMVEISGYDVKFTCPSCGAIRKAGQTPEKATTYLHKDGTFVCRACGFSAAVEPEIFAGNCASVGARKVAERIRGIEGRKLLELWTGYIDSFAEIKVADEAVTIFGKNEEGPGIEVPDEATAVYEKMDGIVTDMMQFLFDHGLDESAGSLGGFFDDFAEKPFKEAMEAFAQYARLIVVMRIKAKYK